MRSTVAVALVAATALVGALGHQALGRSLPSSSPFSSPFARSSSTLPDPPAASASSAAVPPVAELPVLRRPDPPPNGRSGVLGEADGAVPDGVTVFDGEVPAVANLDPMLLDALRAAATDAADEGVTFSVTSGWRSPAYQERLLRDAVASYGSEAEAARWVATPETSAHVSGDAVDLGSAAAAWLSQHGTAYGLCGIYDNEPWHHELRPDAAERGCPARYADPTHDPRMQP